MICIDHGLPFLIWDSLIQVLLALIDYEEHDEGSSWVTWATQFIIDPT